MNDTPFIPKKTADKLSETHTPGGRHKAAMDIAISLIGNGIAPEAVFAQLRAKFPPEKTDKELHDIVAWAVDKNPTPSGFGRSAPQQRTYQRPVAQPVPVAKRKTPEEHAAWWLNGLRMTQEQFSERSQTVIPEDRTEALKLFLELLYLGSDNLNIVCKYGLRELKAFPDGPGRILTRDKWIEYLMNEGIPDAKAGAWYRPNPVKPQGTGKSGAVTDADVVHHRFLLLESDKLPIEIQFALFSKLRLPIAAAYFSGGLSIHTLVRIDAETDEAYEEKARRITAAVEPFGIDQGNKNPSRLSRLPSAKRVIGATSDGVQRLLWINHNAVGMKDTELEVFEESLLSPSIEEKPFKNVVLDSIDRFEDMFLNRGKLGVPTGIAAFDKYSGGLKPGGYTLVCAETGVGKTTFAINLVAAALNAGVGVVLFTLEMNKEDVADMLFSMTGNIDRNVFNTGEFQERDFALINEVAPKLSKLPLWVEDDPDASMEQIRRRVMSLKADGRIGLVVVDYAQLVRLDVPSYSREQDVGAVALALRVLSRKANLPIVVLSQLNDQGKVRESRRLTHEAANVFTLSRKDLSDPKITMFIDKGRKIPSKPIDLFLKAEHCRIREQSPIHDEDIPQTRRHNDE